ncbi:MAG: CHAD domain-containing protein [Tenuifilaceae bacterium]
MQELLKKYSDNCFESLSLNIGKASEGCKRVDVHNLRLNIKKIRALVDITEKIESSLKTYKSIQKINNIFVYSGYLRDIQVEVFILKTYKEKKKLKSRELIKLISKKKTKVKKQLLKQLYKIDDFEIVLLNQKINEIIESSNNLDIQNKSKIHLQDLLTNMVNAVNEPIDEIKLHSIRIIFKGIINFLALLKSCKQETAIDSGFIKKISKLQQEIGKWHDLVVLQRKNNAIGKYKLLSKKIDSEINTLQTELIDDLKRELV